MKATKLIINGEVQNLCDCSNKGIVIPVVSDLPSNPVEGQMVIHVVSDGASLEIYYAQQWRTVSVLVAPN